MKKTAIVLFATVFIAASCKSKKNVSKTDTTGPTESQLTVLKTKEPNATMEDLTKGHTIFYGACTNCHGAKDVAGYEQDKLQKVIDRMASKADLSSVEKDAVWKYALAINLSAKK
ncbi:MAG: hypothetical protein ABIP51_00195 [Bacteroidia bacterium]